MNENSELWRGVAYSETGACLGEHIVRGDNTEHAHQLLGEWFESVCPGSGQLDMCRLQTRPPQVTVSKPALWPVAPPAALSEPRTVPAEVRYR